MSAEYTLGMLSMEHVLSLGFPDCPMGEDERVQLIHCADLDLSNTHFNYIAIPLIIFLIILACCYKIRSRLGRPRDLEERVCEIVGLCETVFMGVMVVYESF